MDKPTLRECDEAYANNAGYRDGFKAGAEAMRKAAMDAIAELHKQAGQKFDPFDMAVLKSWEAVRALPTPAQEATSDE